MAVTATPIFPQSIKNVTKTILNADGTAWVTAYPGGTNGSKIEGVYVSSTDTAAHDLQMSITIGAGTSLYTTINIPIGAGNTGTVPAINILASAQLASLPKDSNGNPYLYIGNGNSLQFSSVVAVTAAKTLQIITIAGDY